MVNRLRHNKMDPIDLADKAFKSNEHMRVYSTVMKEISKPGRTSLFEFTKEDYFEIEAHFNRLQVGEFSCAVLAIFGFGCASILYDLTYPTVDQSSIETTIDYLFALSTMSALLLVLSIYWRTYLEFVWERAKGEHAQHHNIFKSGKYKQLVLEILISILHPVWFLRGASFEHYNESLDVYAEYSYNGVLACMTIFRIYLPIRFVSIMTYFRSGRAQRVCSMNGSYASSWFAVKCLMRDKPLLVVSTLMMLSIAMGGYAIRIFERPFASESGQDFSDYGNTMWLAILTMTTVGYGDFFPVTFMGRACVFVICLWGILVVSLTVVTLTNLLTLDSGEANALILYNRLRFKEKLKVQAAKVITGVVRYRSMYKRDPDNSKFLRENLDNLRITINHFRNLKLQQRSLYDLDTPDDRIERRINALADSSDRLEDYADEMLSQLQRLKVQREAASFSG